MDFGDDRVLLENRLDQAKDAVLNGGVKGLHIRLSTVVTSLPIAEPATPKPERNVAHL
jgi:hypothetical protein